MRNYSKHKIHYNTQVWEWVNLLEYAGIAIAHHADMFIGMMGDWFVCYYFVGPATAMRSVVGLRYFAEIDAIISGVSVAITCWRLAK